MEKVADVFLCARLAWFQMILIDWVLGRMPYGARRSSAWPRIRKEYLSNHSSCECCGGTEQLEVHHKKPVRLFPELELDYNNLVTLCEKRRCHLTMGHLHSYQSYNPDVEIDVAKWEKKIRNRPKG